MPVPAYKRKSNLSYCQRIYWTVKFYKSEAAPCKMCLFRVFRFQFIHHISQYNLWLCIRIICFNQGSHSIFCSKIGILTGRRVVKVLTFRSMNKSSTAFSAQSTNLFCNKDITKSFLFRSKIRSQL